jgi:DNA-binding transcriptional LysR family regulator
MKYHACSASKGQDMTLVQLRHLIALADTGSFSRAAERVNLTQPALSRSIQSLEEELGAALFDRIGRRAELTPMGREILDRARLLVLDAQDLQERARATAQGRTGRLRVGMGSGPAALLATPLLLQVAATRPQWRVEVARGATELLAQRLRARTLDALVVDLRSLPVADDLHVELARELRGAFMVRPGHPLARRRVLHFEDVRAFPLAGIPLSAEVASALVALYGSAAHPDQALSVRGEDIASLVEVVQRSDAVLLSIRAAAPGLLELPLDPPMTVSARLGLVTLARRTPPASLEVLRELAARLMVEPAFPHSR